MEDINFLNYVFSILAVLLSAAALRIVLKNQEHLERELKDLRDKIRQMVDANHQSKKTIRSE